MSGTGRQIVWALTACDQICRLLIVVLFHIFHQFGNIGKVGDGTGIIECPRVKIEIID